jgi:Asp-tRNA(Asn)/Glu-tRNA(Gln) amidotransferase A subunit family amidase
MMTQQAKGERDTLVGRILVTESSIKELEAALEYKPVEVSGILEESLARIERRLSAIINVNLTQLKGNLKEGAERVSYLNEVIKQAESLLHRATALAPGKH